MTNPTPDQTEQEKFDAEVAEDTSVLDALERHYSDLETVIAGLKAQPAAQAMNFSSLDVFSMRLKADSLGQLVPPTASGEIPAAPPAAADSRPGDVGIAAVPPTPQPAPTNVPVTQPASTMVAPGQATITDQPASTMIPPVGATPTSVAPVGTPSPATPGAQAPVDAGTTVTPSVTPPAGNVDAKGAATTSTDSSSSSTGSTPGK
jgi:hypothetical protein